MKRLPSITVLVCAAALLLAPQGTAAQTQWPGAISLNAAMDDFSSYINGKIPGNTLTAVADVDTPVQKLGNYIAGKLTDLLLNNTGLRMVSRKDYEKVLSEQDIQTGAFDDETTAKIGHNLGWHTIVYGSVEPLQESYHLFLRAVDVETGELKGSRSYMLAGNDPVLVNIINPNITIQSLSERESWLAPFNGKQNDFELSVNTNKTVYYDSETMSITLQANMDCYFVVYHLDIDNNMQVIYPNRWERDMNYLRAGVERIIPENTAFLLHEPYGEERILVYASDRPINIPPDQYQARSITKEYIDAPEALWRGGDGKRALTVTPRGATAQVSYSILPK